MNANGQVQHNNPAMHCIMSWLKVSDSVWTDSHIMTQTTVLTVASYMCVYESIAHLVSPIRSPGDTPSRSSQRQGSCCSSRSASLSSTRSTSKSPARYPCAQRETEIWICTLCITHCYVTWTQMELLAWLIVTTVKSDISLYTHVECDTKKHFILYKSNNLEMHENIGANLCDYCSIQFMIFFIGFTIDLHFVISWPRLFLKVNSWAVALKLKVSAWLELYCTICCSLTVCFHKVWGFLLTPQICSFAVVQLFPVSLSLPLLFQTQLQAQTGWTKGIRHPASGLVAQWGQRPTKPQRQDRQTHPHRGRERPRCM